MAKRPEQAALSDAITRFEDEVRAVAVDAVRSIVLQEVERRLKEMRASIAPARHPRRVAKAAKPKSSTEPSERAKPKQAVESTPSLDTSVAKIEKAVVESGWTRDTIVSELATWLGSGTSVDASFITRHGPRVLVAAAKKPFGRFDAALNVASLQVSKMYPDGPPGRRAH